MNAFRFRHLVNAASAGLAERSEIVSAALLTVLSGQSVFFYGPPGTAKSLIARRIAGLFQSSAYFECLMNRFTAPEEIFGPVSIRELKNEDRYVRKAEGYLPTADFAFLDEIWKSSPGILNALLTILNERKFRNGDRVENVPLKAIIAASNEIPSPGQGLEALYDRFVMRIVVPPIKERKAFEAMLCEGGGGEEVEITASAKIGNCEWRELLEAADKVKLSAESLEVLHAIRAKLAEGRPANGQKPDMSEPTAIYVSDRRWMKAMKVAKTAAAICGREEVLPIDIIAIIANCLWSRVEECEAVRKMVKEAVAEIGMFGNILLQGGQRKSGEAEKSIATKPSCRKSIGRQRRQLESQRAERIKEQMRCDLGVTLVGCDLRVDNLKSEDVATLERLLGEIEKMPKLAELCRRIGRQVGREGDGQEKRVAATHDSGRPTMSEEMREELTGVVVGRSIENALPAEVVNCGDEDLGVLFDLKFTEGRMSCFEKSGEDRLRATQNGLLRRKASDEAGPMIICVDTSGSMCGRKETIAKAVTLALAVKAREQHRKCHIIEFSTEIKRMEVGEGTQFSQILHFIAESFSGGTDAEKALSAGIEEMKREDYRRADLLMVSDLFFGDQVTTMRTAMERQRQHGNRFYALDINNPLLSFLGVFRGLPSKQELLQEYDYMWSYDLKENTITSSVPRSSNGDGLWMRRDA